ncbi:DUF2911 domain-containing protein [Pseudozobellia sp. WGM2]|uniref:DUF2911 domain-containing protein n=1 Tax=Pseudozobellia sp. WGM2 TaxID=2787625 RepID=UPI001ADF13C4|nr:DUF2911 domain-containing protein [Pseudozobellia sp. WGM2]
MKILKWTLLISVILGLLFVFVLEPYMKEQTKTHSPEVTRTYQKNEFNISVNYSSPSKKEREIFGNLVPYGMVWRTGANEPTTFATETNIRIAEKSLPAGTYSLWTIPGEDTWSVIFNKNIPDWGVTVLSGGKETSRRPEDDVLTVEVPKEELRNTIEKFTIDFEDNGELFMFFAWDRTKVKIPINK